LVSIILAAKAAPTTTIRPQKRERIYPEKEFRLSKKIYARYKLIVNGNQFWA